MSEWINEWMKSKKWVYAAWMHEWMNEWNEWMNEWMNQWMNEWMNESMNEWMNEMNEWMNGMNEWMSECVNKQKHIEDKCVLLGLCKKPRERHPRLIEDNLHIT